MIGLPKDLAYWEEAALQDNYKDIVHTESEVSRESIIELLLKHKPNVTPMSILEIGAGYGRLLNELVNNTDLDIPLAYGIEPSANMRARKENEGFELVADWKPIKCKVDYIFAITVIQHVDPANVYQHLEEAAKHLAPGGRLLIQYIEGRRKHSLNYEYSAKEELVPFSQQFGLKVIHLESNVLHPLWSILVAEKKDFRKRENEN